MNKYLKIFISGILAGLCIALGATVYLMVLDQSKILGSLLFGIGLFTIIEFKLYLYTGKVGFLFDNKISYVWGLFIGFIGNVIGTSLTSFLISLTRGGELLKEKSFVLVDAKLNDSWYSILILSFFCGIMIYLAVKGQVKSNNPLGKVIFVFIPVMVFILCGFEHVVANVAYFVYARVISLKTILYFLLMFVGNGLGSIFFNEMIKLIDYLSHKEENTNI